MSTSVCLSDTAKNVININSQLGCSTDKKHQLLWHPLLSKWLESQGCKDKPQEFKFLSDVIAKRCNNAWKTPRILQFPQLWTLPVTPVTQSGCWDEGLLKSRTVLPNINILIKVNPRSSLLILNNATRTTPKSFCTRKKIEKEELLFKLGNRLQQNSCSATLRNISEALPFRQRQHSY